MQYRDSDIAAPMEDNRSDFQLDLKRLDALPSSSLAKITISNVQHHLLDNKTISAHRVIKKALREKFKAKKEKKSIENGNKGTISGYPLFVKENYQKVKEETGLKLLLDMNSAMSNRWKTLSNEEKAQYSRHKVETGQPNDIIDAENCKTT